jgi:hypothetical protein
VIAGIGHPVHGPDLHCAADNIACGGHDDIGDGAEQGNHAAVIQESFFNNSDLMLENLGSGVSAMNISAQAKSLFLHYIAAAEKPRSDLFPPFPDSREK